MVAVRSIAFEELNPKAFGFGPTAWWGAGCNVSPSRLRPNLMLDSGVHSRVYSSRRAWAWLPTLNPFTLEK
jgi:hypothetical protein